MANTYFQFKQFTIHQENAALKVCTDACLFGAWIAAHMKKANTILDIGAGTGLLMMMVAQQNNAHIHGIEIDIPSYEQALNNINRHTWQHRMQLFHGDARDYVYPQHYDWIISNPPFFEHDVLPTKKEEQVAKHSTALTLTELLEVMNRQLTPDGQFGIVIPFHRHASFIKMASQQGFYLRECVHVQQTPKHAPFRSLLRFGRSESLHFDTTHLIIREETNDYSPSFKKMLHPYYLHL